MFVVRITVDEDKVDFKAFSGKEDAVAIFDTAGQQISDGDFEDVALFEVSGTDDAGEAVDAVLRSDKSVLTLLGHKETLEVEVGRLNLEIRL